MQNLRIGVVEVPLPPWTYPDCFKLHLTANKSFAGAGNQLCGANFGAAIEVTYLLIQLLNVANPTFHFFASWNELMQAVHNGTVDTSVPEVGGVYSRLEEYGIYFIQYTFYNSMDICLTYCKDAHVHWFSPEMFVDNVAMAISILLSLSLAACLCYFGLKIKQRPNKSPEPSKSPLLQSIHFWFDSACSAVYFHNQIKRYLFLKIIIVLLSFQTIILYQVIVPAKFVSESLRVPELHIDSWRAFSNFHKGSFVKIVTYGSRKDSMLLGKTLAPITVPKTVVSVNNYSNDDMRLFRAATTLQNNTFLLLNTIYVKNLLMRYNLHMPEGVHCFKSELCIEKGKSDTLVVAQNNSQLKETLNWAVLTLHSLGLIHKISRKYGMLDAHIPKEVPTFVRLQIRQIAIFYSVLMSLAVLALIGEIIVAMLTVKPKDT